MTMYDNVWLYMTIYDYTWLYMTIYDYVWLCMTMCDFVCLYMTMHDSVCLCLRTGSELWDKKKRTDFKGSGRHYSLKPKFELVRLVVKFGLVQMLQGFKMSSTGKFITCRHKYMFKKWLRFDIILKSLLSILSIDNCPPSNNEFLTLNQSS